MFIRALILFCLFFLIEPGFSANEDKDMIPLRNSLEPEDKIMLNGTAGADGTRAQINLQSGDCKEYFTKKCEIALHFDMRQNWQNTNGIYRSHYTDTFKDIESHGGAPIRSNSPFYVEITIKKDNFLVHVNGYYFCTYKHRVSLDRINQIWLVGVKNQNLEILNAFESVPNY